MKEHAAYRQEITMPLAQFLLSHIGRRHDIRMTGLYGNTDLQAISYESCAGQ